MSQYKHPALETWTNWKTFTEIIELFPLGELSYYLVKHHKPTPKKTFESLAELVRWYDGKEYGFIGIWDGVMSYCNGKPYLRCKIDPKGFKKGYDLAKYTFEIETK